MAHLIYYAACQMHIGGVERNVLQTISALHDRYTFTVMTQASPEFQTKIREAGGNYCELAYLPPAFSMPAIRQLAHQLKYDLKADLIHTLEPRSLTIGGLAGRLAGIPVVHRHSISPMDYSANPLKKLGYALGEAFLSWGCLSAMIFVSENMYQRYTHYHITPRGKSYYIPVAVEVDFYRAVRQQWQIQNNEFLWVNLGRYHPQKAQDILIDAAAKLPQNKVWKIILAGGGALEASLSQQIETMNLQNRVILAGSLAHEQAIQLLAAADGFVLPSRYENMPNAVLEAMAMNIPCIVTDVGDSWRMSGEGDLPPASLCVPVENVDALANAMRQLMEDQHLYQQLSQAGLARASRYNPQKTLQQLAELYERFL